MPFDDRAHDPGRRFRATPRPFPLSGRPPAPKPPRPVAPTLLRYEADVADGLEALAVAELRALFGDRATIEPPVAQGGIVRFGYTGPPRELARPRTVLAISSRQHFPVPRPRALLGDAHLRALLRQIAVARACASPAAFGSLYLSAAGAESAVMQRLKEALAEGTGLTLAPPEAREGDLQLRLRRPPDGGEGWEALVRLTPRPLSARPWRVCNREGALNATVAQAAIRLADPDPRDHFLNLGCGSGTLLIERALHGPAARLLGYDLSAEALDCARANVAAAGLTNAIELRQGDARALPLPDASIDALCADLPFGHRVGSHDENLALYPALLVEAARVARREAPCVLISHELRLLEGLIAAAPEWRLVETLRVSLGGLHPGIFVLRRT
jgi:tRNA (guanine6-N2)-methyltransferase